MGWYIASVKTLHKLLHNLYTIKNACGCYTGQDQQGVELKDMPTNELMLCPFCGGEARIIAKPYEPKVCVGCDDDTCLGFSGLGWLYDSEKEATEAWNRRADIIEPSCDRDALLRLARYMDKDVAETEAHFSNVISTESVSDYARRIREACGEVEGLRN